jgi:transcriptional regulator with XRE-family HTH domain
MQSHIQTTPASIVRSARRHLGLSQAEFAEKVGRTQTVISKYEAGLVNPPALVVIHCMNVLAEQPLRQFESNADPKWESVALALANLNAALEAVYAGSPSSR